VLKWVVPQLISCWDDERADVNRTLNRIVTGIFHHPSLRDHGDDGAVDGRRAMFGVLEKWWREKDERDRDFFRDALSREGVQAGRNHKEGVYDSGHGCGKPLAMSKSSGSSSALGGPGAGSILGGLSDAFGGGSGGYGGKQSHSGEGSESYGQGMGKLAGEAVGGSAIGGIVGGILGTAGAGLLGDAFGGEKEKKSHSSHSYGDDGSYTQSYVETGHRKDYGEEERYGQAKYSQTSYSSGGGREEYSRYEQEGRSGHGASGYGYEERRETRPTYGGGYEQTTTASYERPGGYRAEIRSEGRGPGGEYYSEAR
jgi:Heterokaryon incompatibility protein Het-C